MPHNTLRIHGAFGALRARRLGPLWFVLLILLGTVGGARAEEKAEAQPAEKETSSPPVVTEYGGLASAVQSARKTNEPVLAVFSASWCGPCQTLKSTVLQHESFQKSAGPLHWVRIDVDQDRQTAERFEVQALPDLVLMSADGYILARRQGAIPLKEMLKWIAAGRERLARGEWEGQAFQADPAQAKAKPAALVAQLAAQDPSARAFAMRRLRSLREQSMPALIQGLGDAYLGSRIACAQILADLAPDAPRYDAWAAKTERAKQAGAVGDWWKKTKTLPAAAKRAATKETSYRIEAAIKELQSDRPVVRTRAMASLVRQGEEALPALRALMPKFEATGNAQMLALVEDVRWAILIPPEVETLAHARRELSRGDSEKRQKATLRLSGAQQQALPALERLIRDPDAMVRESAITSLRQVGGPKAHALIAALLKDRDANLRMVAAQTLGQTKSAASANYLAGALRDDDEVVACAAIAAMEEVKGKTQAKALIACLDDERWRVRAAAAEVLGKLDQKQAAAKLQKLLDDPDSFVLRKALESLKKLGSSVPEARLLKLADEKPDLTGVVAKFLLSNDSKETATTILALYEKSKVEQKRAILDAFAQLNNYYSQQKDLHWRPLLDKAMASDDLDIRRKIPTILTNRSIALAMPYLPKLLDDSDEFVRNAVAKNIVLASAFHWGTDRDRGSNSSMRGILARYEDFQRRQEELAKQAAAKPPATEPKAMKEGDSSADQDDDNEEEIESGDEESTTETAIPVPPESDDDELVVETTVHEIALDDDIELVEILDDEDEFDEDDLIEEELEEEEVDGDIGDAVVIEESPKPGKANKAKPAKPAVFRKEKKVKALLAEYQALHEKLAAQINEKASVETLLAWYVTGDGKTGLPELQKALADSAQTNDFDSEAIATGSSLVMARLPWPEGEGFLKTVVANPRLYGIFFATIKRSRPEARDYLMAPERVIAAMQNGDTEISGSFVSALLGDVSNTMSLYRTHKPSRALMDALSASEVPLARAVAIFAAGSKKKKQDIEPALKAIKDPDARIRRVAAQIIGGNESSQEKREELLAPLLDENDGELSMIVAFGLLTPQMRQAAEIYNLLRRFKFGEIETWTYGELRLYNMRDTASAIPEFSTKPEWLKTIHALYEKTEEKKKQSLMLYALLCAQYKDHSLLDRELAAWKKSKASRVPPSLLLGLKLTRDEKYLEPFRKKMNEADSSWELREMLKYLVGIRGKVARKLRRELNRRIRDLGN